MKKRLSTRTGVPFSLRIAGRSSPIPTGARSSAGLLIRCTANGSIRVRSSRGRAEPGARNPCCRKRQKRHQEEMDEVDPHQSQRRRAHEPHKVMLVDPDNDDEQIAHRIADGRGPQRPEGRECRLIALCVKKR
jgi:hypothetical protein